MRLRIPLALTVVSAAALLLPLIGAGAQAAAAPGASTGRCALTSARSQVETGSGSATSSVADVIGVACPQAYGGQTVQVSSAQLSSLCNGTLSWYSDSAPSSGGWGRGESFDVVLDDFGNATAVVWGGPGCQAGSALITADRTTAPTAVFTARFRILLPASTSKSITPAPASEVEDATHSGVAVVFNVEFPAIDAGRKVLVSSPQLSNRCGGHLNWYRAGEARLGSGQFVTTTLDDDGNTFAVALAGPSCAPGKSLVSADLDTAPYTTVSTHFTIGKPGPAA